MRFHMNLYRSDACYVQFYMHVRMDVQELHIYIYVFLLELPPEGRYDIILICTDHKN